MRAHTQRTADLVAELTKAVVQAEHSHASPHETSSARAAVRAAVRTLASHLAAGNSAAMAYVTTSILNAWDHDSWHTSHPTLTDTEPAGP